MSTFNLILVVGFLIAVVLLRNYLRSPTVIGRMGERKTQRLATKWLLCEHESFHDIILPTNYGTTQVDHVILCKHGIFVIETKNLSGWIYGNPNQRRWTQIIFKEKHYFQNPLHQNYKHVKAVVEALGVEESKVHSAVVFSSNDCTLKTEMPANVGHPRQVFKYINNFTEEVFSPSELSKFQRQLDRISERQTKETHQQHVQDLKTRHDTSNGRCPKCGKALVVRTAKRGKNAGSDFWGCTGYPKCKFTKAK